MSNLDLTEFDTAISTIKASKSSKVRDVVIHATKLHMVYGVPISDAVKHTGRASNDEKVNRVSVYQLIDKVNKTIAYIRD